MLLHQRKAGVMRRSHPTHTHTIPRKSHLPTFYIFRFPPIWLILKTTTDLWLCSMFNVITCYNPSCQTVFLKSMVEFSTMLRGATVKHLCNCLLPVVKPVSSSPNSSLLVELIFNQLHSYISQVARRESCSWYGLLVPFLTRVLQATVSIL